MDKIVDDYDALLKKAFPKWTLWRKLKRKLRFFKQRWTRGWDDSDTWSLDATIAKFAIPRLKRFKELNDAYEPTHTAESWDETIDKMISALEFCADYDKWYEGSMEEQDANAKKVKEGLELFGKHFRDLWW